MRLEFDLDAPTCERQSRRRFRNETRCVTALFERCCRFDTKSRQPWKILVEVVEIRGQERVLDVLGVLKTQVKGKPKDFFALPTKQKLELSLEYLLMGISEIVGQRGWSSDAFLDAAAEVERLNFRNEWIWSPGKSNSSRTLTAEILVEHRVECAEISAQFTNSSGELVRKASLVVDEPNEFIFDEYLGTLNWIDNHSVELISRSGEKRFVASVE